MYLVVLERRLAPGLTEEQLAVEELCTDMGRSFA
jgi:hypothetical protein